LAERLDLRQLRRVQTEPERERIREHIREKMSLREKALE
jgi:hypothetical protein